MPFVDESIFERFRHSITPSPEVSYSDCIEYCHLQPARVYHHTGPVNTMYGLREGLAMLAEEGLEKCWQRHKECAEKLHQGRKEGEERGMYGVSWL